VQTGLGNGGLLGGGKKVNKGRTFHLAVWSGACGGYYRSVVVELRGTELGRLEGGAVLIFNDREDKTRNGVKGNGCGLRLCPLDGGGLVRCRCTMKW